ncbi:unnamed protein product [Cylindrotheca closterium]|uniref:Uncharacterized protein n=1 Tax=Cylindrotheca closterium TaxID=2856 RepID=A0AAD2FC53_9STRA|nr:unnamed protein product [Cylindrotheca closterium]
MQSPNDASSPTTDVTLEEVDGGQKREVTLRPEQEALMKKRHKVANHVEKDVEHNDGNSNERHRVCEFLVQNLNADGCHASSDYSVSLLVGRHGFHLWSIVFDGTKYRNGWRVCPPGIGAPRRLIDEQDVRPLKDLEIQVGHKGKFEGESATFSFVVTEIDGVPEQESMECPNKMSCARNILQSK